MADNLMRARKMGGIKVPLTAEEQAAKDARDADYVARTDERHNDFVASELKGMDPHTTRVLHDLVDALVTKGTIALTDLPQAAQDKLAAHKAKRGEFR